MAALVAAAATLVLVSGARSSSPVASNVSRHDHESAATATGGKGAFLPTVPNLARPAGPTPTGMQWIPGGEFSMGAADAPEMNNVAMHARTDSRPIHRVYVDGFWMDTTLVTNKEFDAFVRATG